MAFAAHILSDDFISGSHLALRRAWALAPGTAIYDEGIDTISLPWVSPRH